MSTSSLDEDIKLKELFDALEAEEKIILYATGALDNTPIKSKTKFQKLLFLISTVFKDYLDLLEFEPHLFGAYSEIADDALEDLVQMDLVEKKSGNYRLTITGQRLYSYMRPKKELETVINDFKEFLDDLSQDELLAFVYVTYPDFVDESVKWEEIQRNRVPLAISLLKKQKVSFSKAAEIAGVPTLEFSQILQERGIKWRV